MNEKIAHHVRSRIANEILAYLADHPNAQDSLEGIVEWWLLEQKIMGQTKLISAALAELVEEGFVLEIQQEKTSHYRLNRKKYASEA